MTHSIMGDSVRQNHDLTVGQEKVVVGAAFLTAVGNNEDISKVGKGSRLSSNNAQMKESRIIRVLFLHV